MKIKNEKELFDLFVADKDEFRDNLKTPFIPEHDGRVWATDGYVLIMVNPYCISRKYEIRDFGRSMHLAVTNCDELLSVPDLRDALSRCPQEPEMKIKSKKVVRCPECEGTGVVTAEYEADYDDHVYEIEVDCPICDGEGTIEEEVKEPTGNSFPTKDSIIKLGKGYFRCLRIYKIIKACEMLKIDKIKLVRTSITDPSTFELDKDVNICVMPMNALALSEEEKKSAPEVKFTELKLTGYIPKQTKR